MKTKKPGLDEKTLKKASELIDKENHKKSRVNIVLAVIVVSLVVFMVYSSIKDNLSGDIGESENIEYEIKQINKTINKTVIDYVAAPVSLKQYNDSLSKFLGEQFVEVGYIEHEFIPDEIHENSGVNNYYLTDDDGVRIPLSIEKNFFEKFPLGVGISEDLYRVEGDFERLLGDIYLVVDEITLQEPQLIEVERVEQVVVLQTVKVPVS